MGDLVERLRGTYQYVDADLREEAADEIERLQGVRHMEAAKFLSKISAYKGRVEELEGALKEIVSLTDRHHSEVPHYNKFLFIARKALNND